MIDGTAIKYRSNRTRDLYQRVKNLKETTRKKRGFWKTMMVDNYGWKFWPENR